MKIPPVVSGAGNLSPNVVQGHSGTSAIIPPETALMTAGDGPQQDPHVKNGKLTRAGMVAKIKGGASVMFTGMIAGQMVHSKIITTEAELPSLTDLAEASGNPDDLNTQIAKNEAQIALFQADNERLRTSLTTLASKPAVAAPVVDPEKEMLKSQNAQLKEVTESFAQQLRDFQTQLQDAKSQLREAKASVPVVEDTADTLPAGDAADTAKVAVQKAAKAKN